MKWDSGKQNGVLVDFDVSVGQNEATGKNEITGTLPFKALDLLDDYRFGRQGAAATLYRHEAESFSWILLYLCYAVAKRKDGSFYTSVPPSIREWFSLSASSNLWSKVDLHRSWKTDPPQAPLHKKLFPLAKELYHFWTLRYVQRDLMIMRYKAAMKELEIKVDEKEALEVDPMVGPIEPEEFPKPYEETEERRLFLMLVREHQASLKPHDFAHMRSLFNAYVKTEWPEVGNSGLAPSTS